MVLGLLCEGTTVIRNAERLRLKESDRIAAMEAELVHLRRRAGKRGRHHHGARLRSICTPRRAFCTGTTTTGWS